MTTTKKQTAIRFRPETDQLLVALQHDMGLTKTGVIELAIREMAKQRSIRIEDNRVSESREGAER